MHTETERKIETTLDFYDDGRNFAMITVDHVDEDSPFKLNVNLGGDWVEGWVDEQRLTDIKNACAALRKLKAGPGK